MDVSFWRSLSGLETGLFVAPFVLLLLSIAVLPLVAHHWWEKNWSKAVVALVFGVPVAAYLLIRDWHKLLHAGVEYAAFIALLASLYVITGGIHIKGPLRGTPIVNTLLMGIGAVLANLVGTTGASMLLIRPILQANESRPRKSHVIVFFIFIVSNCGGCLTPLGDPPLYLGFLQGVPFDWTLRLVGPWAFVVGGLLGIFYLIDRMQFGASGAVAQATELAEPAKIRIEGAMNFLFLLGVIGVILVAGYCLHGQFGEMASKAFQIAAMSVLAVAAYRLTPVRIRQQNKFTFAPIAEVAILFAGIFAAMIPTLEILHARGAEFGIERPWQFFWMTGALSAFLDNAPAYLTFTNLAKGVLGIQAEGLAPLAAEGSGSTFLVAISCGAVFMGALSYIGNGPNFMVKAIAEEAGVRMPGFFTYILWAIVILVPLLVLTTLIFIG